MKNYYPKVTPVNYSLKNYTELSEHRKHSGSSFTCAPRLVEVQNVWFIQLS